MYKIEISKASFRMLWQTLILSWREICRFVRRQDRIWRRCLLRINPLDQPAQFQELDDHIEDSYQRWLDAGMDPDKARQHAIRQFGNRDAVEYHLKCMESTSIWEWLSRIAAIGVLLFIFEISPYHIDNFIQPTYLIYLLITGFLGFISFRSKSLNYALSILVCTSVALFVSHLCGMNLTLDLSTYLLIPSGILLGLIIHRDKSLNLIQKYWIWGLLFMAICGWKLVMRYPPDSISIGMGLSVVMVSSVYCLAVLTSIPLLFLIVLQCILMSFVVFHLAGIPIPLDWSQNLHTSLVLSAIMISLTVGWILYGSRKYIHRLPNMAVLAMIICFIAMFYNLDEPDYANSLFYSALLPLLLCLIPIFWSLKSRFFHQRC